MNDDFAWESLLSAAPQGWPLTGVVGDACAAITHNSGEGDPFADNGFDRRADLPKFISGNDDASNRAVMFTNCPCTMGISLQRSC